MLDFSQSIAARVFYHFQEISKIPHGSGNTKAISDYCVDVAKKLGLEYYQDHFNDVIIIREATAGYEEHKPYIIQGHLDMVCEKNSDVEFDFEKDPLNLYVEDGYLKARGTTLGADDGIAVAYALALLEKEDLKSPRLEIVLTVDEETGMYGAKEIDLSVLKGRDWLNLDSEGEGVFLCGCAGGISTSIEFPLVFETVRGQKFTLRIHDLEGGHSGDQIHVGHGNATIMLGRVLQDLNDKCNISLVNVCGGTKGNAIPREAEAIFIAPEEFRTEITALVDEWRSVFVNEYAAVDPEIKVTLLIEETGDHKAVTKPVQNQIINTFVLIPNDVVTMSKEFPGHVESSTNAGICRMNEERFYLLSFIRSNVYTKKRMIANKIKALAESLGGIYKESDDYPAWEFKKESPLRSNLITVYEEMYGTKPQMDIIHAGLECGLFQEKRPDLDCVAFGPNMHGIHTPKERLEIASVERVWEFLLKLLEHGNLC